MNLRASPHYNTKGDGDFSSVSQSGLRVIRTSVRINSTSLFGPSHESMEDSTFAVPRSCLS